MNKMNLTQKGLSLMIAAAMGLVGGITTKTAQADTFTYGGATLVQPDSMDEEKAQMTDIETFATQCNAVYNYLKQFINYDHMQADTQSLYYLTNIEYISPELKDELISKGIVFDVNIENNEGIQLLADSYNLINMIADYNQSQIRLNENFLPESIINVANFCYDEHDAKLVNDMHENYFYAYKNGRFPNDNYTKVFKQLTTLNAAEHEGNASELSVGARWLAQNSIGGGVMQLLRDDMQEDFSIEEKYYFFVPEELNKGQWIMNPDIRWDLNCLSEHEFEVFNFGELWTFVYDLVNNDLFRYLEGLPKSCCDEKCAVENDYLASNEEVFVKHM